MRLYFRRHRAYWRRFRVDAALFFEHPLSKIGLVIIGLFAVMTLAHPVLMRTIWDRPIHDPIVGFDIRITPHPTAPSSVHPLGTDGYGRDVLSQLLFGARVSFGVGILAAVVAVSISTVLGGAAGYFGGALDLALMGLADVFVLLPAPIALLIFGLIVRLDWPMVALLYGILTGLGAQAVIVKSYTLSIKVRPYIEAARVAGGGNAHIIFRHIIPALLPLTIVHGVFTVVGAVLTESLLSFFGRTRTDMSWGTMIWLGQQMFRYFTLDGQWHAIIPPAVAIMLFCSAFYLVGRALDDVVNPRLRKR